MLRLEACSPPQFICHIMGSALGISILGSGQGSCKFQLHRESMCIELSNSFRVDLVSAWRGVRSSVSGINQTNSARIHRLLTQEMVSRNSSIKQNSRSGNTAVIAVLVKHYCPGWISGRCIVRVWQASSPSTPLEAHSRLSHSNLNQP